MANSFIGRIKVMLGLNSGEFEKGVKKGKKQMTGFQKWSKSWAGQMTSTLGAVFAVDKLIDFGKQAVNLAGQLEGVEVAFKKINQVGLLDELRSATQGTLSDLKLMQAAVKFENFKLPVKELGTLMEFVQLRAQQTGDSMDYLTDSMVEGLSKQSKLRLDNLQISMSRFNEELQKGSTYAEALGTIAREELDKAGGVAETSATNTARLSAEWENLLAILGKGASPAIKGVTKLLQKTRDLVDTWRLLDGIMPKILLLFDPLGLVFNKGAEKALSFEKRIKAMNDQLINSAETVRPLQLELENLKNQIDRTDKKANPMIWQVLQNEYSRLYDAIKTFNPELKKTENNFTELTEAQQKHIAKVKELRKQQQMLKEDLNLSEYVGSDQLGNAFKNALEPIKKVSLEIDKVKNKIHTAFDGIDVTESPLDEWAEKQIEIVNKLNEGLTESLKSVVSLLGEGLASMFEGAGVDEIAKNFLSGFASILMQFGQLMIGLGLGLEAFKTSLATLNPAVAIGAGVALIAAAGAIKGFLNSSGQSASTSSGGGSSFGGGSSGGNSFGNGLRQFQNPTSEGSGSNEIQFRIQGKDLVGIQIRYNKTNRLTT